ncbi:MAG: NAD-dependent epimerase/dehydratase family protein [Clostridiaceae bacterium]|nr:NAD-dependent epimerase/dehydratase family protein [Clostridiaceae bacterium]
MTRVLISGGAGFIGSNLAVKLSDAGYEVTVLDCLSAQIHGEDPDRSYTCRMIRDRVELIRGDVRDSNDWRKALEGADAVVHLAAETGTGQSMYAIEKYVDTNIGGTARLLDLLANEPHNVKKLIVASSRAVYGEGKYRCGTHGIVYPTSRRNADMASGDFEVKCPACGANVKMLPTDEESVLGPTSVYGHTKQSQEQLSMIVGRSLGIPTVAFRFQNVYGPGQSLKNPYTGILSIFSTRIKNGNDINVFEDGRETRDFVYIDDVTDAILLGLSRPEADFRALNVGSGECTDVLRIAGLLIQKYRSSSKVTVTGDYRIGDIRHNLADLRAIRETLGYEPRIGFEEGISRFIDWVEGQETEPDRYEASIREMENRGLFKK